MTRINSFGRAGPPIGSSSLRTSIPPFHPWESFHGRGTWHAMAIPRLLCGWQWLSSTCFPSLRQALLGMIAEIHKSINLEGDRVETQIVFHNESEQGISRLTEAASAFCIRWYRPSVTEKQMVRQLFSSRGMGAPKRAASWKTRGVHCIICSCSSKFSSAQKGQRP